MTTYSQYLSRLNAKPLLTRVWKTQGRSEEQLNIGHAGGSQRHIRAGPHLPFGGGRRFAIVGTSGHEDLWPLSGVPVDK